MKTGENLIASLVYHGLVVGLCPKYNVASKKNEDFRLLNHTQF
jgi:hypothetical protein